MQAAAFPKLYLPALQRKHALLLSAPVEPLYLPAAQGAHKDAPTMSLYFPATQEMQDNLLPEEEVYFPATQGSQIASLVPPMPAESYFPGIQAVQVGEPPKLYVPCSWRKKYGGKSERKKGGGGTSSRAGAKVVAALSWYARPCRWSKIPRRPRCTRPERNLWRRIVGDKGRGGGGGGG